MKILFIYAHIDDETILSYGTMKKFKDQGHEIYLVTFCKQRKNCQSDDRLKAYCQIVGNLGIQAYCGNVDDLSLTNEFVKQYVNETISRIQPDFIITHSMHDMHFEHRLISENILLETRTTEANKIKRLWTTTSQTYNWTYGKYGIFQPNVFIDITKYMQEKVDCMSMYFNEIPSNDMNDNRSIQSTINWNKMHGNTMHVEFCEPYEQIFALE